MQDYNTETVVIPGGLTSMLQPLDVCINKPFKDNFRKKYTDWMAFGKHSYTPAGKMRKASVQEVLDWIDKSWEEIDESVVRKSFKKCEISNNMDGTEDDILWNSFYSDGLDAYSNGSTSSSED